MNFKRIIASSAAAAAAISVSMVSPALAQSSFGSSSSPSPAPEDNVTSPDNSNNVDDDNNNNRDNNTGNNSNSKTVVVNQGDYIQTTFAACTLAYVGEDFAITAAHCGSPGAPVYQHPFEGGKKIGHYDMLDREKNQDVAIIKLEDNVTGTNSYSGGRITSMAEMSKDDILCQYGVTTNKVQCGPQYGLPRYGFMWSTNSAQHGDSGGPVWIEGKGLIGVISTLTDKGTGITEAWITADKYGVNAPMAESTANWAK